MISVCCGGAARCVLTLFAIGPLAVRHMFAEGLGSYTETTCIRDYFSLRINECCSDNFQMGCKKELGVATFQGYRQSCGVRPLLLMFAEV